MYIKIVVKEEYISKFENEVVPDICSGTYIMLSSNTYIVDRDYIDFDDIREYLVNYKIIKL